MAMTTQVESVCCMEQDKVKARAATQDGIKCITEHDGFSAVCLNEHVLLTAYYQFRQRYGPVDDEDNRYVKFHVNLLNHHK